MGTHIKATLNKKNVFYILFSLILLFNIAIYIFQSIDYESSYCEQYLVATSENFILDDYIEKNPNSIRGDLVLVELNLFPDLNSLKCLGAEIDLESNNKDLLNVRATSNKLLKLTTISSVIFIYLLFILFSIKSLNLFLFLMITNFNIFSLVFFGSILKIVSNFDYQLLIYPFSFLVFYFLEKQEKQEKLFEYKLLNLFLFVNVILLLFNYYLYTQFLPYFLIFYILYFKNVKLGYSQIQVITFSPIFYYFLRQLSGPLKSLNLLWENLSSGMYRGTPRFADMYYTFKVLKCNATGCTTKNNYGPLWEFLSLDINVEIFSYTFSILFIFLSQKFYYEFIRNLNVKQLLIYFIYISPPTTFLFERMNFDIFVIVLGLFALKIYQKGNKNISFLIITLLTLVKIFPIAFLVAIAIYEYINKNYRNFLISFFYIFFNTIVYLFYFTLDMQEGFIANPTGITWTFGVLSDLTNSNLFFGNFGLYYYLAFLVFSLIIYILYLKEENGKGIFTSKDKLIELSYFLCFFFIALYYNFDFRITFFSIGFIYIIKNYNHSKFEFISLLYLLTCVSKYFTLNNYSDDPLDFFHSLSYIVFNQLTFNLLIIFLGVELFLHIKKMNVFSIFYDLRKYLKN